MLMTVQRKKMRIDFSIFPKNVPLVISKNCPVVTANEKVRHHLRSSIRFRVFTHDI